MRFHAEVDSQRTVRRESPGWRRLVTVGCGVAVVATGFAWSRVQFASLWGASSGPRGVETAEGFSCLMASMLTLMFSLLDDRSQRTRAALLPGMLMTTLVAAAALLWRAWQGPHSIRGLTAVSTPAFHLALLAAIAVAGVTAFRFRRGRRETAAPAD